MASESEKLPLSRVAGALSGPADLTPEPPDIMGRQLSVGGRLLCGAVTFFFMSFLFAYFYLRSLNNEGAFREHHLKPDQALGGAFVGCLVLSMLLSVLAARGISARNRSWVNFGAGSVLFGLLAVAFQCLEYTQQNFGPTNGAWASIFCGWTAFQLIVMLMGLYWLETNVATEFRARGEPAPAQPGGEIKDPDLLIAPAIGAAAFFWTYLGALGVIAYIVLYIV
jgi:heme/copper-type cytochrome/quinol oxidase subunit 3